MVVVNEGKRAVTGLAGEFDALVSGQNVGRVSFERVTVPADSSERVKTSLVLVHGQVAAGMLETIRQMRFTLGLHGLIRGNIVFGLLAYERPVTIDWIAAGQ